jgi:hypothetical protein
MGEVVAIFLFGILILTILGAMALQGYPCLAVGYCCGIAIGTFIGLCRKEIVDK